MNGKRGKANENWYVVETMCYKHGRLYIFFTGFVGPDTGLTFILNTTTSDYYFSTGDHVGFNVQILTATEFPDIQNGGLTQLFIDSNKKAYFKLIPTTIQSKSAIEQYSPVQRGCLFEHELFSQYAGHYSFVDCLLKCKLRNIINICGCMPFTLPTNFPDDVRGIMNLVLTIISILWKLSSNFLDIFNTKLIDFYTCQMHPCS